jgi:hypothetical protein
MIRPRQAVPKTERILTRDDAKSLGGRARAHFSRRALSVPIVGRAVMAIRAPNRRIV